MAIAELGSAAESRRESRCDGLVDRAASGDLGGVSAKQTANVLRQVADRVDDQALIAARESDRRSELAAFAPARMSVPWMFGEIHDVAGLARIAGYVRGAA